MNHHDAPPPAAISRERARAAQAGLRALLTAHAGVCGLGLRREPEAGYVLVVNLQSGAAAQGVPATFEGVPVRTRVTGTVRPLS